MTGGQIFIVVATSRPDMIDSALLRPGRIARHIYVGLPTLDERRLILETRLRDINLCDEVHVTLETLMTCAQAETMTGADWKGVVDTAFLHASAEHFKTVGVKTTTHESINLTKPTLNDQFPLTSAHFLNAFGQIKPSLSHQELSFYEGINKKFIPSPSSTGSTASDKPKPAIGVGKKQCFA
jgi:transitional endoplasmic reticulum ATPase